MFYHFQLRFNCQYMLTWHTIKPCFYNVETHNDICCQSCKPCIYQWQSVPLSGTAGSVTNKLCMFAFCMVTSSPCRTFSASRNTKGILYVPCSYLALYVVASWWFSWLSMLIQKACVATGVCMGALSYLEATANSYTRVYQRRTK